MPFHNFPTGINDSPLVKSMFVQNYSQAGDFPPPQHTFWVESLTEAQMVTPDGDKYIFQVE